MPRKLIVWSILPLLSILLLGQALASGARPEDWAPGSAVKRVAAGGQHSCAIMGDNTIHCWGANVHGQIGNNGGGMGFFRPQVTPARLDVGNRATMVSTGRAGSCALTPQGTIACWGLNEYGELGTGDFDIRRIPAAVPGLENVRAVSIGDRSSCAVLYDGRAFCWGNGAYGKLGIGASPAFVRTPTIVKFLTNAVDVDVASGAGEGESACALLADGRVHCWGRNDEGQLGNGQNQNLDLPAPVSNLTDAIGLAVGERHACALRRTGGVVCWGRNDSGQLGNGTTTGGTTTDSNVPVAVSGLTDVTSIAAGGDHSCARRVDGTVRCWGANSAGQLGNGTTTDRTQPVAVSGLSNVLSIDAGAQHSCALLANDTLRCWGEGADGRLGNGLENDQTAPAAVSNLSGSISARLISSGSAHNCAIRSNGTVACWGNNSTGQVGDGTTVGRNKPTTVPGLANIVSLAIGSFHTCALQVSGQVSCWGDNKFGQLGNGDHRPDIALAPVLTSITDAVAIVSGTAFTCASRLSGAVYCWGDGRAGQLGDGHLVINPTPKHVLSIGQVMALGAGEFHACALRFDGALHCWGGNQFGQVGDGTVVDRPMPRTVSGAADFVAVELGGEHSCGIRADGTLSCWGANDRGQLGNGTTDDSLVPATVSFLSQIRAVAGGGDTTCAIGVMTRFGTVSQGCWGRNDYRQTSEGTTDRKTPLVISPPLGEAQVTVGFQHACAMRDPGVPTCWGRNTAGQIGQGTITSSELIRTVPSFALNLLPNGTALNHGQGAMVTVVAACAAGAQARLVVTVKQGAVTARGKGRGACTGALEFFQVLLRTRDGRTLTAGPAIATAVAQIVDGLTLLDTVEWSRQVALAE